MKGYIDEKGALFINRTGVERGRKQTCPLNIWGNGSGYVQCGDWCPLFGEPEKCNDELSPLDGKWWLELCHGKGLLFDEFEDRRVKGI